MPNLCSGSNHRTPKPVPFWERVVFYESIEVASSLFFDGVAAKPTSQVWGVVAVVVVDQCGFGIVVFGRPLEGLRDVAGSGDRAEGRVTVLLNRERARRRLLRRIPQYEPKGGVPGARQIHACDLQIPAIDVAVMQRDRSRDRHFFEAAAALAVVAALDHGLRFRVFEAHRAVRAVVFDRPRSRGGLNRSRVPVGVVAVEV